MIESIRIIAALSAASLTASLLSLLISQKAGKEKAARYSLTCIVIFFLASLASMLGILLHTHGILENRWVQVGCLLGGMLWLTLCGLSVDKLKNWRGPALWMLVVLGVLGALIVALGLELFVAVIFIESITTGIALCTIAFLCIVAVTLGTKERRREKKKQAAKRHCPADAQSEENQEKNEGRKT